MHCCHAARGSAKGFAFYSARRVAVQFEKYGEPEPRIDGGIVWPRAGGRHHAFGSGPPIDRNDDQGLIVGDVI
jgi:hypothetical protein